MTSKEAAFAAKLLEAFKIEAEEHLKALSDGFLAIENGIPPAEKEEAIETIFREAHSLKGAARAVDLDEIQDICQSLETLLAAWKYGTITQSPAIFDTSYAVIDLIGKLIANPSAHTELEAQKNALIQKLDQLAASPTPLTPYKTKSSPVEESPKEEPYESPTIASSVEGHKTQTIRVSAHKLDKLMQQVEEMLVVKLALKQQVVALQYTNEQIQVLEKNWIRLEPFLNLVRQRLSDSSFSTPSEQQIDQRIVEYLEWQQTFLKSLQSQFLERSLMSIQNDRLIGGMVDALVDDTKKVLMQPFSTLLESFPRMVRDLAHSLGKEVQLELEGGDIEVDRRILEEMKAALIHLIRNSIDHWIESAEERKKWNKSPVGHVRIAALQVSGNSVEILISDDGGGIDIEKVKQSVLKQGVLQEKDISLLTQDETLKLIFHSGVSTSPIITELSGRGLGLGIASEKVEKLGGQVFIETKEHEGTTFRLMLPLTMATFRGIHIQAAGRDFIIPTQNIKRVLRIKPDEVKSVENRETILLEGKAVSLIPLSVILGIADNSSMHDTPYLFIVIIKAFETTIALSVDSVLNEQEVFVKTLGKQLARVKNISAATILEGGKVVPILDPFDLVKSAISSSTVRTQVKEIEKEQKKKKTILLAEDSATARMLLKNILDGAGYDVKTAVNGIDALSLLKTEKIDLLLSDVEMPRLNGFELTEKVRQTEKFKDLPIVLCTSRGSKEDREHGIDVGADAYIDKSSFMQSNLLSIVQKLL